MRATTRRDEPSFQRRGELWLARNIPVRSSAEHTNQGGGTMMSMKTLHKRALLLSLAASLSGPGLIHAGGFSLLENTGSGIGYAYAGAAASADDASVLFFNPAGIALLNGPQAAFAVHGINLDTK